MNISEDDLKSIAKLKAMIAKCSQSIADIACDNGCSVDMAINTTGMRNLGSDKLDHILCDVEIEFTQKSKF